MQHSLENVKGATMAGQRHADSGHPVHNPDIVGFTQAEIDETPVKVKWNSLGPGIVALCTIGCGADANPVREGPMQLELSRWFPHSAWHRYDNTLARRQVGYEANGAVRLFGAGRYHDLIFSMDRLVINTNRYWPKRSLKAMEW